MKNRSKSELFSSTSTNLSPFISVNVKSEFYAVQSQRSITWEQRKLGELALFNPKDELPQTFEYVDLESVVGTEMLSHRTEVKSSAPSRAQRLANTGDLFYQTVRPYQKNNYLFEKPDNNYVFSTGYAQMRPYVDGYFLLSLVQSERFVKVVLDNCTGTSYPAINANDLAEIEVAAPSDESEAQKIGAIFRSIDNLITLHQRKQKQKSPPITASLVIYGSICFDCFMSVSNTS